MSNFGMDFSKLLGQLDKVAPKTFANDEDAKDYWKQTKDKDGNASSVIRFLPNKDIDDFPFVRTWSHGFFNKVGDKKRWYIETSLSTIGETDYIAEVNRELWNTEIEENKKIAKNQKRKLSYISNILVIKDALAPENEGKVFKFKYGQKIFDKIVAAAKPEAVEGFDDIAEPINAFSPINGADFLLVQTVVQEFPNYDGSKFSSKKPLFKGDEDKIAEVMDKLFDLNVEVSPAKMKSYDELKKKYLWVMNIQEKKSETGDKAVDEELDKLSKIAKSETPAKSTPKEDKPTPAKSTPKEPPVPVSSASDDEDDDAAFFSSLIND